MNKPSLFYKAGVTVFFFGGMAVSWIGAYYASYYLLTAVGWELDSLVFFLIETVIGFFLFGLLMAAVSPFVRGRERTYYNTLFDALERISRGDFRVSVNLGFAGMDHRRRGKHPLAKLEDSINEMAANLSAMDQMRQEFVSNVSHEIGTPLTSIGGFAKALRDESLDPKLRERYLTIIETECARLSRLSDNLLKLAALDSERHSFSLGRFRLDKQIVKAVLGCEPQWAAKRIELTADTEEIEVEADEDLLNQVWVNLIHNAVKFTPEGGAVEVSLQRAGDRAVVRVVDNGPGIAPEDMPRLFERFYKADKSRNRTVEGSGLGLSIVRKIVELHHGTITVQSKPGEGAAFTVELPLRQEASQEG